MTSQEACAVQHFFLLLLLRGWGGVGEDALMEQIQEWGTER